MIDFKNGTFVKLKKVDISSVGSNLNLLLLPGEEVFGVYKDICVISVNVQDITGKKQDFTSMPYKKISVFSIETAGVLDLDSELEMYFSGVGMVKFEFSGKSDIVKIGQLISKYTLE